MNKYQYINKTPTWLVRTLYVFGIVSWLLVLFGFSGAVIADPFYRYLVAPILLVFTVYHLLSFSLNLFYKKFDLRAHKRKVSSYWNNHEVQPSIDVFVPICNESLETVKNTLAQVSRLAYKNYKVYILEDSTELQEEHKRVSDYYGFTFLERSNKGEMKKAGNLKYAYENSDSEFVAIFDIDFAPDPNFLYELLPYMSDKNVGIVQSPQYFETKTKFEKAAAYLEELFYRVIQVSRNRVGGAICCGSNAIYRREAINAIGGTVQVDASEDSRTGFRMLEKGYKVEYVPIILATGASPDNAYSYFNQQHRWCRGRSQLVLSEEFKQSKASTVQKLCNISGFLSFICKPLELILSFQLFYTLFAYNEYISWQNALPFYSYIVFSFILLPLFHLGKLNKEVFIASCIQHFSATHALINVLRNKASEWVTTGSKITKVSSAFKETRNLMIFYVAAYTSLIVMAVVTEKIHLFNWNYYSLQFWVFWNLFFFWTTRNLLLKKVAN